MGGKMLGVEVADHVVIGGIISAAAAAIGVIVKGGQYLVTTAVNAGDIANDRLVAEIERCHTDMAAERELRMAAEARIDELERVIVDLRLRLAALE